jgi:hypothetical protein
VSDEKVQTSYKNDFETLRENKDIISDIDKYRPYFDKKIDKSLSFQL